MASIELAFQEYYRPLCLYAMHYLSGDVDAAEDVVQDCFVRLWQREADNDRAFLYTAVRNACIDRLRRNDPLCHEVEPQDLEGTITDEEAQDRSFLEARLWKASARGTTVMQARRTVLPRNSREDGHQREDR